MISTVATLWIGNHLSFLERLSLKSFYDIGQVPILYHYDPIDDLPDYVISRDAREVMDEDFMQEHWGVDRFADPRVHADIFRIMMMNRTDHTWVDTDVFALQPHIPDKGYLFAERSRGFTPNGVLRVPKDSPALASLTDFVCGPCQIPPWWSFQKAAVYNAEHPVPSFDTLPVGVTGPEAVGHFLRETREHRFGRPFADLYPVLARHTSLIVETPSIFDLDDLRQRSMSLHFYATRLRRWSMKGRDITPQGSLLKRLCDDSGIDPAQHPVVHRDSGKSVSVAREFRNI